MKPDIALLVPCYNAAFFLPRFHNCLSQLTLPFTEVLCFDDGSTDDTVKVAKELGFNILEGRPNRGVAHARNELVRMSKAEWVHFHDADDLISPEYLVRLGSLCMPEVDVISCDADWIGEEDRKLIIRWRYSSQDLKTNPYPHLVRNAMGLNSSIIRRSAWQAIGGCDERLKMWEDADVHIRLARAGYRFDHVPEVLTWSLRRPTSFSHDYRQSWTFRLLALEGYAAEQSTPNIQAALAEAAEVAAAALAELDERAAAERAIALCRRLGRNPPTSNHPLIRALRPFLPTYPLLRWQAQRRSRAR